MENTTTLQTIEENLFENNTFKSALKFEIELQDGTTSQLVTFFNGSEVYFEDIVKHTHKALSIKSNHNIKAVSTTLGNLKDGFFQNSAKYSKIIF